jgi:SAM-dependent methyltransferase
MVLSTMMVPSMVTIVPKFMILKQLHLLNTYGALTLPFAADAFGAVMSFGLLEHFAEEGLSDLLGENARVLPPGGVFVADIVPGRVNARTVGIALSFCASAVVRVLTGQWRALPALRRAYFHHYFESTLDADAWTRLLSDAGLVGVDVRVCRPFPPLALAGAAERIYASLMRRCLPLWRRFDDSRSPLARAWGWMYLCTAVRGSPPGGA